MGVGVPLDVEGLSAGLPFLPLSRMTLARKSIDRATFDKAFLQRMVYQALAIAMVLEYFLGRSSSIRL